jgi:hypothetical protein
MRGEHRFHLLLALAGAALSVSLMGGAEYIPLLKEHPGAFFWVFLFLAVACFIIAVRSALLAEADAPRPRYRRRMFSLLGMVICGGAFLCFTAAYFWPSAPQLDSPSAIARLTELGWTVKPSPSGTQFEVVGRALPPMEESAKYFARLSNPFWLHLQSVTGLEGLHFLAGVAACKRIEINAGEFTDISELRGFTHLDSLVISQVPLSGPGTVDASALASLTHLTNLGLNSTRVRNVEFLSSLTRLRTLNIGQTLVGDISPLAKLPSLEALDIRGTRVVDLQPLSYDHNLKELSIGGLQIPGLISFVNLETLKKLTIILEQQPGLDLTPVGSLTSLESLMIWAPMSGELDVAPLRSLVKLRSLALSGAGFFRPLTAIANIDAMADLTDLRTLTLGSLQLTDIAFVAKLTKLEELNINEMPISSIEPLRNLKSLKKVSLNRTGVVDISPLLELPALTTLTVGRTPARSDVLGELERRGVKVTTY